MSYKLIFIITEPKNYKIKQKMYELYFYGDIKKEIYI